MFKKPGLHLVTIAVGAILAAGAASAGPVYDTSTNIELTGSRTTGGGGLIKGGGNVTSASLSWVITDNGNGTLHYKYTFTENSQQGISHFILDLSDNCGSTSGCLTNATVGNGVFDLEYGTFASSGNPNFPGSIVGVKFDDLTSTNPFVFEFDSNREAVWGDFYAKGGNGSSNGFAIYNDGADEHLSEDILKFIARPDTQIVVCTTCTTDRQITDVPEPATLALLGAGLLGLGLWRRRRSA